jgi:hypothetical protein
VCGWVTHCFAALAACVLFVCLHYCYLRHSKHPWLFTIKSTAVCCSYYVAGSKQSTCSMEPACELVAELARHQQWHCYGSHAVPVVCCVGFEGQPAELHLGSVGASGTR